MLVTSPVHQIREGSEGSERTVNSEAMANKPGYSSVASVAKEEYSDSSEPLTSPAINKL
jgi:hypothetical protein